MKRPIGYIAPLVAAVLLFLAGPSTASHEAHIDHLLTAWQGTATGTGILISLDDQLAIARQHASLAAESESIGGIKAHLEHVVNTLVGAKDHRFISSTMNPGDGYGIIPYINDAKKHVSFAANEEHAPRSVTAHSEHVQTALGNVENRAGRAVTHAEAGLNATTVAEAKDQAMRVLNHVIVAIEGEGDSWQTGGVATAIQHTNFMGG